MFLNRKTTKSIKDYSDKIQRIKEYWAYWSRYITINRYMDAPKPVYKHLFELVKDKDYFVLTTKA